MTELGYFLVNSLIFIYIYYLQLILNFETIVGAVSEIAITYKFVHNNKLFKGIKIDESRFT